MLFRSWTQPQLQLRPVQHLPTVTSHHLRYRKMNQIRVTPFLHMISTQSGQQQQQLTPSTLPKGSAAVPFQKQKIVTIGNGGYLGGILFGYLQRAATIYTTGIGGTSGIRSIGGTADIRRIGPLTRTYLLELLHLELRGSGQADTTKTILMVSDASIIKIQNDAVFNLSKIGRAHV